MKLLIALFCVFAPFARAQLLYQALIDLPGTTKSIEYDNLAELRNQSSYAKLREQYAGTSLQRVKAALNKIGISEDDLQEVVMASGPSAFYGIVSGTFSAKEITKNAMRAGVPRIVFGKEQLQCPEAAVSITFLGDATAAFGTENQLKDILDTRRGAALSVNANSAVTDLLQKADMRTPVIGIAQPAELVSWIGTGVSDQTISTAVLSKVASSITMFGYSVASDRGKAHVTLNLLCASTFVAESLKSAISALGLVQAIGSRLSSEPSPCRSRTCQ